MEACKEDREKISDSSKVVNKNESVSIKVTNRHAFDCCICSAFLTIPVFECDNGHIVCSTCCDKRQGKCHKCSKHSTLKRSKAIENLLQYIEIPCPKEKHGCKETKRYIGKSKHEEKSIDVPHHCPVLGCDFVASSEVMSNHFRRKHSLRKFSSYDYYFHVSLNCNDEAMVLQAEIDGKLFILNNRTMLMGKAVLVNVSCIDPNSSKDDYSYDILARSKNCSLTSQSCPKNVQRIALATISSESLMIPFPFGYFSSNKPLSLEIRINRMIYIFIKNMFGKIYTLRVRSSDTILDVKHKILDIEGMPLHEQRLILNCMQLDDEPTLKHYKIEDGSILHLVLRLHGS